MDNHNLVRQKQVYRQQNHPVYIYHHPKCDEDLTSAQPHAWQSFLYQMEQTHTPDLQNIEEK